MGIDTVKINTPDAKNAANNNGAKLSVLNIGQILFLAFLFMMLLLQSVNIYTDNSSGLTDGGGLRLSDDNRAVGDGGLDSPGLDLDTDVSVGKGGIVFVLGEHQGKLAILSSDRKIAYEVFDVYIDTLPDYDRILLSEGIEIRSADELRSLLEDYSS